MHVSDTPGFCRPVFAKPDCCQVEAVFFWGKLTKLRHFKNPNLRIIWPLTGFYLVVYNNSFFPKLISEFQFWNRDTHQKKTNKTTTKQWLFLNPSISIPHCKATAASLIARDGDTLLSWKPSTPPPSILLALQWSWPSVLKTHLRMS